MPGPDPVDTDGIVDGVMSMATDLPDTDTERLQVTLPTADEHATITGIVRTMSHWTEQMTEAAASGDLLRVLHLSHSLCETNAWLAGYVDKVMDVRA